MTGPREVRIDRLVLPAGERHSVAEFRAALMRGLAAELSGDGRNQGDSDGVGRAHPAAARTARAVAERIRAERVRAERVRGLKS